MSFNYEYKRVIRHILAHGKEQEGRNGGTIVIPHYSFIIYDLASNWKLTLRKMHYKGARGEWNTLMDVKNPLTNVSQFEANGCPYWSLWASEDGALNLDYFNRLHPQLEDVIEGIKKDKYSRRHVVDLWQHENVKNDSLSLACCWYSFIFSVIGDTLHMTWNIRSQDAFLGLPSDVALAWYFMEHVAKECNLETGNLMYCASNIHLYDNSIVAAKEILKRTENDFDKPLKVELIS